jgi:hypothetical protein
MAALTCTSQQRHCIERPRAAPLSFSFLELTIARFQNPGKKVLIFASFSTSAKASATNILSSASPQVWYSPPPLWAVRQRGRHLRFSSFFFFTPIVRTRIPFK